MRCPKCHTETPKGAANCPGCNLRTPKGKYEKAKEKSKEKERAETRSTSIFALPWIKSRREERTYDGDKRRKNRNIIRAAIMIIAMLTTGFGCYLVVFSYWDSKQVDPVSALEALETLRNLPSNQEGLTVGQVMDQELAKMRDSGSLKSHQGWSTRRVRGSESKVLLVFSFQDNDSREHRAEWLVDVSDNKFLPQTELAWAVYSK